ncbi:MAG: CoA transferase, partial [Desulfatiglandales bacterium]|nr:CoA transferase [Desulfatiglandales bacterium]
MGRQPLEGVKVVDFGWIAVVPISCTYLSQHGAEVIRIESLTRPDEIRVGGPPFKDNIPGVNRSAYFANYNAGKYGVSLNLKHPKGVEIAKRLVSRADIAVEGFTAGTMERLGLGYEELRKVNPDIIMLSTCIHGQTGPHAMHPTLGTQLTALAGFVHLTGWPDRGPGMPFGAYTDTVVPQFV